MRRNPPYLPTPFETFLVALFPTLLLFGTLFSLLSPQTRSAEYNVFTQAHSQDASLAPSYFARKSNIFNVFFVKRGWGWTSLAFFAFLFTHPSVAPSVGNFSTRKVRGLVRWMLATTWWFLITQWCFGPPIIDRGFRWTGGRCELAKMEVAMGDTSIGEHITAVACKAAGGKWKGGHDISGHVFLLVLATGFLMQEVGWAVTRWSGQRDEERAVIMADGALKGASVESDARVGEGGSSAPLGIGAKFAVGVVGLSLWMLLMTAIYFHTWFEKVRKPRIERLQMFACADMKWLSS
jgi:ATP adenylyltransferase